MTFSSRSVGHPSPTKNTQSQRHTHREHARGRTHYTAFAQHIPAQTALFNLIVGCGEMWQGNN